MRTFAQLLEADISFELLSPEKKSAARAALMTFAAALENDPMVISAILFRTGLIASIDAGVPPVVILTMTAVKLGLEGQLAALAQASAAGPAPHVRRAPVGRRQRRRPN